MCFIQRTRIKHQLCVRSILGNLGMNDAPFPHPSAQTSCPGERQAKVYSLDEIHDVRAREGDGDV